MILDGYSKHMQNTASSLVVRWPIYFKREEITSFLKSETHKDLLVAILHDGIEYAGKKTDRIQAMNQLNKFFDSLGYQRVLVLGLDNSGVFVLRDTAEDAKHR
jgi:hypothetical protein